MKKITAALLFLLMASSSFATAKKMYKKKKKQVKTAASTIINDTRIRSVVMGRSACFGQCPAYTIEVFENGLLRYTGKSFAPKEGIYEKNIQADNAVKFIREFNTIRPDTLQYMYEKRIADLPGIYYFINYTDSVKHIFNANDGPLLLKEWAKKFDGIADINDNSWKKQNTDIIKP